MFLFPFGLGITAGMNRTLKIGIGISIAGLCVIMVTRNLYPQFLDPFNYNPQSYGHDFTVRAWLLKGMNLGLVILVVGILISYIGSVVQAWRKRQTLLPFLFRNDKTDK